MLKVTIGVALLLLIALVGYRQTFTRLRLPAGARLVFLTGTEFILVGVALGDELIGLLDEPTIRSLTPLFSLGLGAIGLIFGIQLDLGMIRHFPSRYLLMAVVQACVTVIVVFVAFCFILGNLLSVAAPATLLAASVLAATAACTAQTSLALIDREFQLRGTGLMGLLRYISSLDAAVGLLVLGIAFASAHADSVFGFDSAIGLQWLFLALCLGTVMGFLLKVLTDTRCSEEELMIFVVGTVLLSSGIALFLELSPLFVNAVMGLLIANIAGAKDRIFTILARLEKPVYLVFLILAGAVWHPHPAWALPLGGVYLALRFAGKLCGGFLAAQVSPPMTPAPSGLGLGLIAQGGMAIAMVMNYYQLSDAPVTDTIVSIVLVGVIASELVAPTLVVRLLRTTGEIAR